MPDIINAKCFGCGKIIRVPSALGGRNAKCPGCGHIFTIPTPADSTMNIVSDEMLPTVAETGEVQELQPDEPPPVETPSKGISRRASPRRSSTVRETASRRIPVVRPKSPLPLVLGLAAGVVVVVAVIAVVARGRREEPRKETAARVEKKADPEAEAIQARTREYASALKNGRHPEIMEFFDVADRGALKSAISSFLEAGIAYESLVFRDTAVRGDEATVNFTCTLVRQGAREENKTVTLKWKKTGSGWRIAELPR